ncbi:MAG: hypothetical protein HKN76_08625 [Saprospiraceae bacterium]|nr:hypothetical protein [Saprospiraceae bacterium]
MKYLPIFLLCLATHLVSCAQEQVPNRENQIAAAVQAAPEEDRSACTVMGYDRDTMLVTLREGTNNLVCVADDPRRPGFQSVCYHKDLEPFMSRGRALRAEGKSSQEIFDMREQEAKAGTLKMPPQPTTLHLLEGKEAEFDEAAGMVKNVNYRYVVYIPWATAESTGLPLKPLVEGGPWIMDPGTHRAHIMITPPR